MISNLTPIKLRLILSLILLLLTAVGIGIFLLGYGKVSEFALQAQQTATEASASNSSLQDLIATKKTLENNTEAIDRAAKLVAESKLYYYQDQIIKDITQFATESELSIANISFAQAATTTAPTTAPTTADASGSTTTTAPTPAGIKSITATVSLKNPADYDKTMNFLNLVEQSLFRMQISQMSISKDRNVDAGPNDINVDTLTIEVYIR
ncbi:MAG: hypothetical protein WBP12_03600 [Candidatus Saccharimonas sp.]